MFRRLLSFSALLSLVALPACTEPNGLYCDLDTGCDRGLYCDLNGLHSPNTLTNTCVASVSADSCNEAESCSDNRDCLGANNSSEGTCVECSKNATCISNLPNRPVCNLETNLCISPSCDSSNVNDTSCQVQTPSTPYCSPSDRCAACVTNDQCSDQAVPICDPVAYECRKCEEHMECDSNVCDLEAGTCVLGTGTAN